jgi:chemotaxis protein CheD
MGEIYPVGMAELRIAQTPDILAAYGVGSCVIVTMYDPKTKIGGMAHVMLPDSVGVQNEKMNPRKFADTAIPLLLQTLTHAGVFQSSLWVKLVGGAEMFPPTEDFADTIGKKNYEASLGALKKLGMSVLAEEVGGAFGRSLELDLDSGKISISILGDTLKEI